MLKGSKGSVCNLVWVSSFVRKQVGNTWYVYKIQVESFSCTLLSLLYAAFERNMVGKLAK